MMMMIAVAAVAVATTTVCIFVQCFSSVSISLTDDCLYAFRFTITLQMREIQQQFRACIYAGTSQITEKQNLGNATHLIG